jgi:hypothetical protein
MAYQNYLDNHPSPNHYVNYGDCTVSYVNWPNYCAQSYSNSGTYYKDWWGADSYSDGSYANLADDCNQSYYNYADCSVWYSNHQNQTIEYPHAYTVSPTEESINNWYKIDQNSANDIKTIRDQIKKLSQRKLKVDGSVIPSDASVPLSYTWNDDTRFNTGQPLKVEQINETITNVNNLWKLIQGGVTGPLTTKKRGDLAKKADYIPIRNTIQTMAGQSRTPAQGYANHFDSGYNNNSYINHQNTTNLD